jgi:hypothetical protein
MQPSNANQQRNQQQLQQQPLLAQQQMQQQPLLAQQQVQRQQQLQQHARRQRASRKARSSSSAPLSTQIAARANLGKVTAWLGAAAVVFWIIVIATHREWVRLHDGPIVPIPYVLAAVISILGAGFVLVLYLLKTRLPAARSMSHDAASIQRPDYTSDSGAGAGHHAWQDTAGREPAPAAADVAGCSPDEASDTGPRDIPFYAPEVVTDADRDNRA